MVGESMERMLVNVKDSLKATLHGGMLFEALGVRYFGPVEGHTLPNLIRYLELVKDEEGPILLHVLTEKGHGFKPAEDDPVFFHTPAPFECDDDDCIVSVKKSSARVFTDVASAAIADCMKKDDRVTVMTAAMCQGNKLETVREEYPDRFFDVGICESHAVAFAAGQAKAGCRPIVDIYSTFLQRSYDQIFQEVCLQNLPVIFMLDRAGLTGPDGPTHHGVFDLGYMRLFPNMAVLAPADEYDLESMVAWAINHNGPVAIRYPKAVLEPDLNNRFGKDRLPIELGHCEPLLDGQDGLIISCGSLAGTCLRAVDKLREEGLHVGLINARFVKPLDEGTLLKRIQTSPWVVSVEENALQAGFGSAILEAVHNANINTGPIRRLGIPDHFIEHGDRSELLSSLSLDVNGIVDICRELSEQAAANAVATPVRD